MILFRIRIFPIIVQSSMTIESAISHSVINELLPMLVFGPIYDESITQLLPIITGPSILVRFLRIVPSPIGRDGYGFSWHYFGSEENRPIPSIFFSFAPFNLRRCLGCDL